MPEMVKQKKKIADIAAKPPANNVDWLKIHNNHVNDTVRESAAFKKYEDGKRMIAYLCRRHPNLISRWNEKERRNRIAFVKRMLEINRKCSSAKTDCAKTSTTK